MAKYINRIDFCSASLLTSMLVFPPSQDAVITGDAVWKEIPIADLGSLEVSEELEDGQRIFTSKVTAVLCSEFEVPTAPIALRLTLTDGSQVIVGTANRPYPETILSISRGNKASEQSAQTLQTTWKAPCPALNLLINESD